MSPRDVKPSKNHYKDFRLSEDYPDYRRGDQRELGNGPKNVLVVLHRVFIGD